MGEILSVLAVGCAHFLRACLVQRVLLGFCLPFSPRIDYERVEDPWRGGSPRYLCFEGVPLLFACLLLVHFLCGVAPFELRRSAALLRFSQVIPSMLALLPRLQHLVSLKQWSGWSLPLFLGCDFEDLLSF